MWVAAHLQQLASWSAVLLEAAAAVKPLPARPAAEPAGACRATPAASAACRGCQPQPQLAALVMRCSSAAMSALAVAALQCM
ncbi:hypothetical protein COO60DRAFT_1524397 [Scenedesmus sp. NREL 46B-D3]|nr:hypothetical protein COO60DRAFT_1524397 [Scenedesmus sp. NREL 46B-D3]